MCCEMKTLLSAGKAEKAGEGRTGSGSFDHGIACHVDSVHDVDGNGEDVGADDRVVLATLQEQLTCSSSFSSGIE